VDKLNPRVRSFGIYALFKFLTLTQKKALSIYVNLSTPGAYCPRYLRSAKLNVIAFIKALVLDSRSHRIEWLSEDRPGFFPLTTGAHRSDETPGRHRQPLY